MLRPLGVAKDSPVRVPEVFKRHNKTVGVSCQDYGILAPQGTHQELPNHLHPWDISSQGLFARKGMKQDKTDKENVLVYYEVLSVLNNGSVL
jgi:hypothetical protein